MTLCAAWGDANGDGCIPMPWLNPRRSSPPRRHPALRLPSLLTLPTGLWFEPCGGESKVLDLFVGNKGQNELWLGDGSGSFTLVTGWPQGSGDTAAAAWGDLNGDGHLDIIITHRGDSDGPWSTELYMNQGSSLLTTVAVGPTMDAMLTTAIAFGDVNGDGSLDLFAGNGYRGGSYGEANELWLNDGTGVFTATSGAGPTGPRTGTTAAAFGDANGDGHLDLFVGNNLGPTGMDELWVNDGRGQFTNMPFGSQDALCAAWGDANGDGALDIYTGKLYMNDGLGSFTEATMADPNCLVGSDDGCAEVTVLGTRGIGAWGDANNDGFLDIFISSTWPSSTSLWLNDGASPAVRFTAAAEGGPVRESPAYQTLVIAWGDANNDGIASTSS